jgi:UDP-N-acetylglucosamine:LPS N-acetylglucosamine transferase
VSSAQVVAPLRETAADPGRCARHGEAARALARPDAAARIADLVLESARVSDEAGH